MYIYILVKAYFTLADPGGAPDARTLNGRTKVRLRNSSHIKVCSVAIISKLSRTWLKYSGHTCLTTTVDYL